MHVVDDASDEVSMRIGDIERRAVDARLQHAVGEGLLTLGEYDERAGLVWQARTHADLAAVTRDLPAQSRAAAPLPAREPVRSRPRRLLAVMSSDRSSGPVAAGQDVEAYALMGEAVLDLRRDDLPPHVRVRAASVMGSVQVLVPRGAAVQLSGLSLMGSRELRLDPPVAGRPVVELAGYALMGSVEVHHGSDPPPGTRSVGTRQGVDLSKHLSPAVRNPSGQVEPYRHQRRHRHGGRHRVLLAVGALALAGFVGFQVTGQDASSVFGSTSYTVPPDQSTVHVGTMFGSAQVVVPDRARVRTAGTVVFGSLNCQDACSPDNTGPAITVDGKGAFGSIDILTQTEAAADSAGGN